MKKICLLAISFMMAFSSTAFADYVTIGTETSSSSDNPYNTNYEISRNQSIYTAAEIGTGGVIQSLAYNVAQASSLYNSSSVEIYMGHIEVGQFVYSISSETTATVCGTTATGEVSIPASVTIDGKNYEVTAIFEGAFQNKGDITSVTIPSSVTSIGNDAFTGCTGIKEVKIEDGSSTLSLGYKSKSSMSYDTELFINCPIETLYLGRNLSYSINHYYDLGAPFGNQGKMKSVEIGKGVTSIGSFAFYGCSGLTSISIPSSVTSIGYSAFYGCRGLTSISIPSSVTSIGDHAFYGCSGLTGSLTIPSGVTSIGDHAFYGCSGLTGSLTILSGVTSIGSYAFYGCSGLTGSLTIPSGVTSIGSYAFYGCSGLTGCLTIPSGVTSIGSYAFYDCSGLTGCLTIPSGVTSIGSYAFYDCTGKLIVNCNIRNGSSTSDGWFYGSKFRSVEIGKDVTNIGDYAFYNNSGILSLTIGSSVINIGSKAFNYTPTKTIWLANTPPSGYSQASGRVNYVSNTNFSSLSNKIVYSYLSSLFTVNGIKYVPVSPSERTCDAIDCTYLPEDDNVTIGKTVSYRNIAMTVTHINDYVAYQNSNIKNLTIEADGDINQYAFYGSSKLQKVNLNNTGNIGSQAFYGCSQLSTCTVGDAVTAVGDKAFYSCSSLPAIQLGKNIKTIGSYAFYGCSKLQEIAIPDATTSLGTYCFSGCTSLKKADTGDGVTAIPSHAFSGCSALETITIGEGVKTIDTYAFQNCKKLADIAIPSNVSKIDNYVFAGCSKLADVVIADRNEALTLGYNGSNKPIFSDCPLDSIYIGGKISYNTSSSYGYSPFYRNTSLRAVVITNEETEIYPNEFYGCTGLKNVKIGDGVKKIGDYAFSGCSSLEGFTFGSGMQSIGKEAFSDCTALTTLASKSATPPTCGTQALEDVNKWDCNLYVPETSASAYQAADQWKDFFFVSTIEGTPLEGNEAFEGVHRTISDGVAYLNTVTRDYESVTYVRNFTTHDWEAIYLPFAMTYDEWKDDYEVARINAFYQYDDDEDGTMDRSVLQAVKVKSGEMKANLPYLIRAKVPGEKTFEFTDKSLHASKSSSVDCSTIATKFTFIGTYSTINGSALSGRTAYAMQDGALKKVTSTTLIPACRWYIDVESRTVDSPVGAAMMRVFVSEEEDDLETDLTVIESLDKEESPAYLLDGRRAGTMQQGLYVKGAKKIIKK